MVFSVSGVPVTNWIVCNDESATAESMSRDRSVLKLCRLYKVKHTLHDAVFCYSSFIPVIINEEGHYSSNEERALDLTIPLLSDQLILSISGERHW